MVFVKDSSKNYLGLIYYLEFNMQQFLKFLFSFLFYKINLETVFLAEKCTWKGTHWSQIFGEGKTFAVGADGHRRVSKRSFWAKIISIGPRGPKIILSNMYVWKRKSSQKHYIPTDWLILQQYESKKWKEVQNPGHGIFPLRLGPLPYTQWSLATRRWAKRHWATKTLGKMICCPFILLDNESVRG